MSTSNLWVAPSKATLVTRRMRVNLRRKTDLENIFREQLHICDHMIIASYDGVVYLLRTYNFTYLITCLLLLLLPSKVLLLDIHDNINTRYHMYILSYYIYICMHESCMHIYMSYMYMHAICEAFACLAAGILFQPGWTNNPEYK